MKRSGPLKRRKGLERGASELKRTRLRPLSEKKRQQRAIDSAQAQAEAAAFKAAILGERCVVCGKTEAQAYRATGLGHEAHHGVRKEVLKRLGLRHLVWDKRNAVCVCEEPCHRRHTTRARRILLSELPERVVAFAVNEGLEEALSREYPS